MLSSTQSSQAADRYVSSVATTLSPPLQSYSIYYWRSPTTIYFMLTYWSCHCAFYPSGVCTHWYYFQYSGVPFILPDMLSSPSSHRALYAPRGVVRMDTISNTIHYSWYANISKRAARKICPSGGCMHGHYFQHRLLYLICQPLEAHDAQYQGLVLNAWALVPIQFIIPDMLTSSSSRRAVYTPQASEVCTLGHQVQYPKIFSSEPFLPEARSRFWDLHTCQSLSTNKRSTLW